MADDEALARAAQSSFVSSSAIIRSLTEDATTAALATALATLPYSKADAQRWIAAMSTLQAPAPSQPRHHLFTLFTGAYHPVFDALSATELAGCWHLAHYLHTPEHHCIAVEETLLQRFAAGELGPLGGGGPTGCGGAAAGAAVSAAGSKRKREDSSDDWAAALSTAPGERLERRWLALLRDAPVKVIMPDPMSSELVSLQSMFSSLPTAISQFAPPHFGAAPMVSMLWDCATGATLPISAEEHCTATLFGHPTALTAAVASLDAVNPAAESYALVHALDLGGHMAVLDNLSLDIVGINVHAVMRGACAFRGGQRAVAAWLASKIPVATAEAISLVISGIAVLSTTGDVDTMTWLWQLARDSWGLTGAEADWTKISFAWRMAGLNSQTATITWMLTLPPAMRTPDMLHVAFYCATTVGCIEVMQLFLRPHASDDTLVFVATPAARGGRLRPLQALRALQPPFPLPASLLVAAAYAGRREAIEYLQSPAGGGPYPWTMEVTTAAARDNHYALLKWLVKEQNCPYSEAECVRAAMTQGGVG